jgi:4,5-dihydroxyphthalate decarboxylase
MNPLELTLAIHDYDHTRDLVTGQVPVEGVRLRTVQLTPPELNARFSKLREWEVSEFGLGKYIALRAAGDDGITAIPVFPARAFRQSAIYVRAESPLHELEALAGTRVGVPEWAQTAVVWARGLLADHHGVDLASIDWHQAGVDEPGRTEKVAIRLPDGVRLTPRPDATLQQLLLAGELDAVISAQPLASVLAADGRIRTLLADPRAAEEEYVRSTGIFPIMHLVAIRRDVYDAHPWVARNLMTAFEDAKRRSEARLVDAMSPRLPLPWIAGEVARTRDVFGGDPYPYGIEPNRRTLDALLDYATAQGVAARRLQVEELFAPTVLEVIRR